MQHEDYVKTQWWLRNLMETDRKIVGRKRRDVQRLIHMCLNDCSLEDIQIVAKPRRILFRDEVTSLPLASSKNEKHTPRMHHPDWQSNWPSMEVFYQQMSLAMCSLTNSEVAYAMCNPTKQIQFRQRDDPQKQKELEDELRDWLPVVDTQLREAKLKFEQYYPPIKPIIRNKENIVWGPEYRHLDVKTLRTVMEHELAELGMTRLQKVVCSKCCNYFPANQLRLLANKSVACCQACWDSRVVPPLKTLFHLLIVGISEKWARMVGQRVACLYGEWPERLTPMVTMLKENVLLEQEIASLLKSCNDFEEFADACEVIIATTMVFYLEYVDFRRSCESLINKKPDVADETLFEIFAIYFPNRAKGIKTGDFL